MYVNPPEAEYGRTLYCDTTDSGPVQTGHPAARRAGVSAVVGKDENKLEGSAGEKGGSSGVTSNGGGIGFGNRRRTGRGLGRKRGGGVPGSERFQWSGVERGAG